MKYRLVVSAIAGVATMMLIISFASGIGAVVDAMLRVLARLTGSNPFFLAVIAHVVVIFVMSFGGFWLLGRITAPGRNALTRPRVSLPVRALIPAVVITALATVTAARYGHQKYSSLAELGPVTFDVFGPWPALGSLMEALSKSPVFIMLLLVGIATAFYYLTLRRGPKKWDAWYALVEFEDKPGEFKERPVILMDASPKIGRPREFLALYVTSQDHDHRPEYRQVDTTSWDTRKSGEQSRSWVRVDSVLRVPASRMRRKVGDATSSEASIQIGLDTFQAVTTYGAIASP